MDQVQALEDMIGAGKLSEALDLIEGLSQEERNRWQIQNLTGIVCTYCGQHKEAATFFTAALEQHPDDPVIQLNLADTFFELKMYGQAEEMLERCEKNDTSGELSGDIDELGKKLKEAAAAAKRKQLLMIAYYFPPLSGSGVFRSIKFAKYLPQFGWQPTVVSTDQPPNGWKFSDETQVSEIPEGMKVIRVPNTLVTDREKSVPAERIQAVFHFLRNSMQGCPSADKVFPQVPTTLEAAKELFYFPCANLAWAYDTLQYIEENLDLNQFHAIYTTSGPASAHLVGAYLKQKYGIPWVADYRDPWTHNPYAEYNPAVPKDQLLFELESALLHQADCNLTVEESLVESYIEHFHLPKSKLASITNGYDEADFSGLQVRNSKLDQFTITYSGLLYTPQRSIRPVLKAIRELLDEKKIDMEKVQLRIVGMARRENLDVVDQYGLREIIVQTGYLSHRAALQYNLDSNLLLLLVGDEENFRPVFTGKIFDYLRSGRPILALAPKGGVVDQVLQETGHGEAFLSTQIPKIKAMILREYRKWQSGAPAEPLHSPKIERFERKVLTKQLADVLFSVADQRHSQPDTGSTTPESRGGIWHTDQEGNSKDLDRLAELFLQKNYNYVWLKAMLSKASAVTGPDATLITGSSYGVNGIAECILNQAVNCSASSQDLYYDSLCARKVISKGGKGRFSKCLIVDGYYAACHDLSLGKQERELMISNVYYPIFRDGHNWKDASQNDLWSGLGFVSAENRHRCERIAIEKMLERGTFFSAGKQRGGTVFNLNGRNWWEIPEEERRALGKIRAENHNKLCQNRAAVTENKEILKEYVHFLYSNGIMPIFLIAPFAGEYNRYISDEMKDSIAELISAVPKKLRFVDFNQFSCFDTYDFVDTDHLSQKGAEKFSRLVVDLFGQ